MIKYLLIITVLVSVISCQTRKPVIRDHISISLSLYEDKNVTKAAAMPEIKPQSELMKYEGRFYYLLMNVPAIHLPEKYEARNAINSLYPDTLKIKELYLKTYTEDKKLAAYFEETIAPINNPGIKRNKAYTVDELMEVASKFFYCDNVEADTSIQAHVCVGLNGVKEASWTQDYTLLEAFCYEAIFHEFDNENSRIWESFVSRKKQSVQQFRSNITTLDKYLQDVKLDLFKSMKNDDVLRKELLDYYETNKANIAFKITG